MTNLSRNKTIVFGPVVRFRTLDGDLEIIRHAAETRGQTLSAYLRDAAMSQALVDMHCDTREQAKRKINSRPVGVSDL